MTLSELSLTGFRSYRNVTFALVGPSILFSGLNGSGKSTVREAIRWCLTGHCDGTDGKGAGAEVLIPWKGKSAEVSCVIEGIGRVTRTYGEKTGGSFSVEGFTGSAQIQQGALYAKLGTSPAFLDAVLSTETFLNLGHADAKGLVLSLLNVQIPVEDRTYTLDELDDAYKCAFDQRKLAKRDLATWAVPAKPDGQMPPEEAISGQLTNLRTQVGTLRQAIGQTVGQRSALNAELERVMLVRPADEDPSLEGEIARITAEIAVMEAAPKIEPAKDDPTRLTFLRNRADALEAFPALDTCVLHPDIPCATPATAFRKTLKGVRSEIATLESAKAAKAPVALKTPLMGLRRELASLQTKRATLEAERLAFQKSQGREAQIVKDLAALPKTDAQELDLSVLEGRILKGEAFLKDARVYWGAFNAHENATKELERRQTEVARLEALVESLGPNGARVAALSSAMARFEKAVNPYVAAFGWKLTFSVDPWGVLANDRPVETYSKSEQYRIGIALQLGIAHLSGLKFAVVDEIDMLDLENRAIVTKMLLKAELAQLIVLGTREATQALPRGLTAFRLEKKDDRTVISEQVGA